MTGPPRLKRPRPPGWRETDDWSLEGLADFIERVMDNPECTYCTNHPATLRAIFRGTVVYYCAIRYHMVKRRVLGKSGTVLKRKGKPILRKVREQYGCGGYVDGRGHYHPLTVEESKEMAIMARQRKNVSVNMEVNDDPP